MTDPLFINKKKKTFFIKFFKKHLSMYKYFYIKKKQYLNYSPFFSYYEFNNVYMLNIIPVLLMFRLIVPILYKLIFYYKNLMIIEMDPKLKFFLQKFCKSLNINLLTKWNPGLLLNWNYNVRNNKHNLYIPELILIPNADKNINTIQECFKLSIDTISIVSNLNFLKFVTYPIIGNSTNIFYIKLILVLFYYVILNSYIYRITFRKFFFKKKKQVKKISLRKKRKILLGKKMNTYLNKRYPYGIP